MSTSISDAITKHIDTYIFSPQLSMTLPVFGSNLSTVGSEMGSLWLEKILWSSKELQRENTIYPVRTNSLTNCNGYSFPLFCKSFLSLKPCARISWTWLIELALFWSLSRSFAIQHGGYCTTYRLMQKSHCIVKVIRYFSFDPSG